MHAWATQEQDGGESLKLENQGGTYLQTSSSGWTMGGVSLNASPRSHAREKMSVAMAMAGFLTLRPPTPTMFSSETTAARGLSLVL